MAKTKKPPTVESILKECTKEVKKGLGVKRASAKARKYWLDNSRTSITAAIAAGGVWDTDKKNAMAMDILGEESFAKALTLEDFGFLLGE